MRRDGALVQAASQWAPPDAALLQAWDEAAGPLAFADLHGRFLRVNDAFCRLLGMSREDLLSRSISDITHPDDVDVSAEAFTGLLSSTGPTTTFRKRYIDAQGATIPIAVQVRRVRADDGTTFMFGHVTDLRPEEARTQAQLAAALETAQMLERFRLLAEHASDVVYRYRLRPRPGLEYANPAIEDLTGYRPEEHYADPNLLLHMLHPDDQGWMLDFLRSPRTLPEPMTFRCARHDGTLVWVQISARTVLSEDGAAEALEGVARDVTAERTALQALRRRVDQQEILTEFARAASAASDARALKRMAVAAVAQACPSEVVLYAEPDADDDTILRVSAQASQGAGTRTTNRRLTAPSAIHDRWNAARSPSAMHQAEAAGLAREYSAGLVVLVEGAERRYGVLHVSQKTPESSPDDSAVLEVIAATLATALDRIVAVEAEKVATLTDPLTGLPNRTLLDERLDSATRMVRAGGGVALILTDLHEFGRVNTEFGVRFGDKVLRAVAAHLREQVGDEGTVARTSGDEFAVLLPNTRIEAAAQTAAAIVESLETPLVVDGRTIYVPVAAGVSDVRPTDTAGRTLERAEQALRQAEQSPHRWAICDGQRGAQAAHYVTLATSLRQAIDADEISLALQPVIDLRRYRVVAAEALLRWTHQGVPIRPDTFIPIAEATGVITQLSRWVRDQIPRLLAALDAHPGSRGASLAINLAPSELTHPETLEHLRALVDSGTLDTRRLLLEITESMTVDPAAAKWLARFKATGVRIGLDDFGTGYSSFAALNSLPLDVLKLDRTFTAGITTDTSRQAVARAIIATAHALDLTVIAEGIETDEQLHIVTALGAEEGQGYLFSPAVPLEEFPAAVQRLTGAAQP